MTIKEKLLKDLGEGDELVKFIYSGVCREGMCEHCPVEEHCNDTFEEIEKKTGKSPSCIEVIKNILKKEVNLCQVNGK